MWVGSFFIIIYLKNELDVMEMMLKLPARMTMMKGAICYLVHSNELRDFQLEDTATDDDLSKNVSAMLVQMPNSQMNVQMKTIGFHWLVE